MNPGGQRPALAQRKVWFGIAVGVIFLYLFARKASWGDVWQETKALLVDPRAMLLFLVPSIALNLFSVVVRAWRWQSMLGRPWIPWHRIFLFLSIGFMCNNLLPMRAGEFVRTYLIASRERRRFTSVFATVIVERIFDFAVILLFLGTILAFVPFPETARSGEGSLIPALKTSGIFSLVFVACVTTFLVFLAYLPEATRRCTMFMLRPIPRTISGKTEELLAAFTEGLSTFKRPRSTIWCVLLTVGIWLVIGYSVHLLILAFGIEGVPFTASLVIMVAICLAVAAPQAPGYLGVYQFACKAMLVQVYNVPDDKAVAFTVVLWATQIVPMSMMGLTCLGLTGIRFRDVAKGPPADPESSGDSPV